ncbi:iron-containing alcohol dehydrogenase [Liquorilactobacillus nagelii]|jgi:4-hydroxybutyrate dehydrogenase|uniref:iron-containing alcohol dehydrogenase n=1 Tax=Liquorilactobacillus nagelii TaxID=82688 RepID=UPI001CCE7E1F|nr:iron-containing alcohol dehydrogenase [Liquorilactobacillus nagelii]ULQ48957.1 iron-containing alcohol dehydrogenase [Liquorilactobacillus nagelii]
MKTFSIQPTINLTNSLSTFFKELAVGKTDVLLTNKYIITPHLNPADLTLDVIYLEDYLQGEPTDAAADKLLTKVTEKNYQRIIAIGGGSVIDNAKLLVYGSGKTIAEIAATGQQLPKKRQLIIVPTTTGTGSEVTNVAVFNFLEKGTKAGLAYPAMFADQVYLIADLAKTMPYKVFATSSIDALVHAIESYLSPKATSFSKIFSVAAMKTIIQGYLQIILADQVGQTPQGQQLQKFLEASTMAGVAFGNAGCGPVHALAYPIGATYHIAHGQSNYLVFNGTFNKYQELGTDLSQLNHILAEVLPVEPTSALTELNKLINHILPNQSLSEIGMDQKTCQEFAASVIANQQRLMVNSPIKLTETDVADIYQKLL